MQHYDIYKSGGIILKNKKLLVTKSKGKDFFFAPGGKLEFDETPKVALIRELNEELKIFVTEKDLEQFGTFYAVAAGNDSKILRIDVFIVKQFSGELIPDNEIEQMLWIDSKVPSEIKVGSIFEHDVIPKLKSMDLID